MDTVSILLILLAILLAPAWVARGRGLSERVRMQCLIGSVAIGWTGFGWLYFLLLALFESPPAVSVSSLSVRITRN